jgi:hypothetical protein
MREVNFARMAAARQSNLTVGGHQLTITRPSPWDVLTAQAEGKRLDIDWAANYVVGWDFTEADLFPGGDPEPVAFDSAAFRLWIKDYPDNWKPLVKGITEAYDSHEKALAERGNV